METTFFLKSLSLFHYMSAGCVSTFRTCVQGYLEWLPFVFCFLPSFHAFVIDFLSIRKVIIFSAIGTDDRHPLRSRSILVSRSQTLYQTATLGKGLGTHEHPKAVPTHIIKKHIVGGARVSIAELLENHKTTARRLQHWLELIFYYWRAD